MLAKIRERTQGIIATLILGFVAIPFVLWGIGSYFHGRDTVAVAKVNGVEISQGTYRRRLEQMQTANPNGGNNDALKQLVLEGLIDQTLLTSHARDSGYRLGDAQLVRLIHQIPNFQRHGKFQVGLYEAVLSGQGLRPSDFEAQVRQQSIVSQVQQGLSDSSFVTGSEMTATLRMLLEERRVSYAVVDPKAFMSKVKVNAKDIDDYYRANQASFRAPEAVRIDYIKLKAADIAKSINPTESELRQAYEAEAGRYVTPAKRRISHILISLPSNPKAKDVQAAKARAEGLLKQIHAGANFATLARKYSSDAGSAKNGGDLGEIAHGALPAALEAAAAKLKPGQVSEPIRTKFGFHLVKLTAYTPKKSKPFNAVKAQLRDLVRKRKGEDRFYELSEKFRNLVYEHPESLDAAAKALDLKVERSDWFARSGGSGIASQPKVVAAAFDPDVVNGEENSDAIDVAADTLVALHVANHRPAAVRPLKDVRASIEKTLKDRRAQAQAQAAAQKWVEQLKQGKPIASLAHEPGVTLHAAQTWTRAHRIKAGARLVEAVFAAARPQPHKPVVGEVDLGAQGYALYALEQVKDGDPASAPSALKAAVRRELRRHNGMDYYASFRAGLRKTAEVKINSDQL